MSHTEKVERLLKCVVCGERSSGRTSLIRRFALNQYAPDRCTVTVGSDLYTSNVRLSSDDSVVRLQVWDSVAALRYLAAPLVLFRMARIVLFCFAVNDRRSFEAVEPWRAEAERRIPAGDVVFALVATKCDAPAADPTLLADAQSYADSHGMPIFEVSARTGAGVRELFEAVATTAVRVLTPDGQLKRPSAVRLPAVGSPLNLQEKRKPDKGACAQCSV